MQLRLRYGFGLYGLDLYLHTHTHTATLPHMPAHPHTHTWSSCDTQLVHNPHNTSQFHSAPPTNLHFSHFPSLLCVQLLTKSRACRRRSEREGRRGEGREGKGGEGRGGEGEGRGGEGSSEMQVTTLHMSQWCVMVCVCVHYCLFICTCSLPPPPPPQYRPTWTSQQDLHKHVVSDQHQPTQLCHYSVWCVVRIHQTTSHPNTHSTPSKKEPHQ